MRGGHTGRLGTSAAMRNRGLQGTGVVRTIPDSGGIASSIRPTRWWVAQVSCSPRQIQSCTRVPQARTGTSVVSTAVYNQLDATYAMERISGANRYETATALAQKGLATGGSTSIASGSPLARTSRMPSAPASPSVTTAARCGPCGGRLCVADAPGRV